MELFKKAPKNPAIIGFTDIESALFSRIILLFISKFLALIMPGTAMFVPPEDRKSFDEKRFKDYINELVAPESLIGEDYKEVQEELFDFYVLHNKPENADFRFYLERFSQVNMSVYKVDGV